MLMAKLSDLFVYRHVLLPTVISLSMIFYFPLLMKIKTINGHLIRRTLPEITSTDVEILTDDDVTGYRDCTKFILNSTAGREILIEYNYYPGYFLYPR